MACAQWTGVIDDPDGYTNLRARSDAQSAVVARVEKGVVFQFDTIVQGEEKASWLKVTLPSGQKGFMHSSRIRFYGDIKAFSDTSPEDEVNVIARQHGFEYFPNARAAARGDARALQRFFSLGTPDGGWGENHCMYANLLAHVLGDTRLAAFYRDQKPAMQQHIRETLQSGLTFYPFEEKAYLRRHFPKTAAAFGMK